MKKLVAYFSHSGSTAVLANQIHEITDSDIFEIVPVNPYPNDYSAVVNRARQEQKNNYRPQVETEIRNMDSYDAVFVGYPNWCGTIPMIIFSLFEKYNFSGKTIIPFCTHGGGGLGSSVEDIKRICPQSIVLNALAISSSSVKNAKEDVLKWLDEIG
ncbi:flavodoxin [Clostridium sp. LBM24168]